jgi:hypothetical protein
LAGGSVTNTNLLDAGASAKMASNAPGNKDDDVNTIAEAIATMRKATAPYDQANSSACEGSQGRDAKPSVLLWLTLEPWNPWDSDCHRFKVDTEMLINVGPRLFSCFV